MIIWSAVNGIMIRVFAELGMVSQFFSNFRTKVMKTELERYKIADNGSRRAYSD